MEYDLYVTSSAFCLIIISTDLKKSRSSGDILHLCISSSTSHILPHFGHGRPSVKAPGNFSFVQSKSVFGAVCNKNINIVMQIIQRKYNDHELVF